MMSLEHLGVTEKEEMPPQKKVGGGGTYPRDTETNLKEFSIVKAETS